MISQKREKVEKKEKGSTDDKIIESKEGGMEE